MKALHNASHYFIVRKNAAARDVSDIILSEQGVANVTEEDLDYSGQVFRILSTPFQKVCFVSAHADPDQAPDLIRALRKAYPDLTQLVFPKPRGWRASGDYGKLPPEDRKTFWGFLEFMSVPLEQFILDPAYMVVIDGPDDILGDMIKSGLFDMENTVVLEDLRNPELMEKYTEV